MYVEVENNLLWAHFDELNYFISEPRTSIEYTHLIEQKLEWTSKGIGSSEEKW